jgi:hypothetical protein
MSYPNLHLVADPGVQKCVPTVPIMALADVLGPSFTNVALDENALVLAIAAHTEAEFIFEFGPHDRNHAVGISNHMGDGTMAITHDTCPSAANDMQGRGFAHLLKPDVIAKADVLTHVDRLHGKDARLEYAPWLGACDLVLVDASSAYDYVKCDSLTAFHLVKPRGVVLWNNYDSAPGVTHCLNELHRGYRCFRNLRRIADTHLCYWRNL